MQEDITANEILIANAMSLIGQIHSRLTADEEDIEANTVAIDLLEQTIVEIEESITALTKRVRSLEISAIVEGTTNAAIEVWQTLTKTSLAALNVRVAALEAALLAL